MAINVRCPACSGMLRIQESARDKRIKCPKCAKIFQLRAQQAPAANPGGAAPVKKPVKKTALRPEAPSPSPDVAVDSIDGNIQLPLAPTEVDGKPAGKKSRRGPENPDVTAAHLPQSEDPNSTQDLEGRQRLAEPDATQEKVDSRTVGPSTTSGLGGVDEAAADIPTTLGGYQIQKELGRGGMGQVFLARQKSLDRLIALKVMNPGRARDPAFIARFMREAYAAAQLVHHHVVQIHDIGAERGFHFFSMEYVKGETLTDRVTREGKMDPEVAVGYILQAARGLKFGHDLGMVHRDVKPDNLLINDQGMVKVADLGLVKLSWKEDLEAGGRIGNPSSLTAPTDGQPIDIRSGLSQVTRVGQAVGTPTYMAPEQALDAKNVDARVDIYSLGCTLYVLLTGKPPFEGKTVMEVLSKHAMAPLVPPDAIVKRVPKSLSGILSKMLAKKPKDRYANMEEVIAALEKFLGIQQAGPFTPREEHANILEQSVKRFNLAPRARLRRKVALGFAGGCAGLFLLCLMFKAFWLAGGILGLAALTPTFYVLVHGWKEKTFLFAKIREWFLGMQLPELLYSVGALLVFALLLYLFHLLFLWVVVGIVSLGLAVTYYVLVDRKLAEERKGPVANLEKLLRNLRLQGLEERGLRYFICKYSGRDWEEIFETLFGYEAKLKAREWLRGDAAHRRNQYAAWREPMLRWIDVYQKLRREARERKVLQAMEAKALEAQGLDKSEARDKAAQVAQVMVAQAAEIQQQAAQPPKEPGEAGAQVTFQQLLETAQYPETAESAAPKRSWTLPIGSLVRGLAGARFRFFAGLALFTAWTLWMYQNQFLEGERLLRAVGAVFEEGDYARLNRLGEPLSLPLLPAAIGGLCNSFNPAVAAILLMASAFVGGWKTNLVAWPAAAVILLDPALAFLAIGPLSAGIVGMVVGVLTAVGVMLVRRWSLRKALRAPAPAAEVATPDQEV